MKMTGEAYEYILERVIQNALDSFDELDEEKSEFQHGRALAYYEILDTIKSELICHDQDPSEFGIPDNLEKEMLK